MRGSKFDPHIVEIAKYLAAGVSINGIASLIEYHFEDIVDESALYYFIRSRGLQSKVTQGGTNLEYNAPICDKCDDCIKIINSIGHDARLCMISRRMIKKDCSTSPMWCVRRE